jgi:hypothetical protein
MKASAAPGEGLRTPDSHLDDYAGAEALQEFWNWLDHRAIEKIVMPLGARRDESYEKVDFYIAATVT